MSTALVTSMYEFGDIFLKTHKESLLLDRKISCLTHRRVPSPPSPKSQQKGSKDHRKLDRSLSESSVQQQQQPRPNQANSSRYKTELCRPYEENGICKYGDKCQFAHGAHELRTLARHPKYKTELCRTFHSTGFCPYGPRCHFIHNSEETKKNLLNHLQVGPRPKALSLGSVGDPSPPSSMSGSPTSLNSFFGDETFNCNNMAANNAFGFSQDFAALVKPVEFEVVVEPISPPSPVDSLGSDMESLSISSGGSLPRLPIFSRLATV